MSHVAIDNRSHRHEKIVFIVGGRMPNTKEYEASCREK